MSFKSPISKGIGRINFVRCHTFMTMKTLENNWRQKSIETLEKDFWGQPPKYSTPLVEKVHRLRTIQIEKLEPKDLRLLISQNVGLKYLIPVAFDILHDNIFIDTEFFEGDLLKSVITVENSFWNGNKELTAQLDALLRPYSDEDKEKFRKGNFNNLVRQY
jgi:hypothetical protein